MQGNHWHAVGLGEVSGEFSCGSGVVAVGDELDRVVVGVEHVGDAQGSEVVRLLEARAPPTAHNTWWAMSLLR
jgi:hypothetical protein